jgi:lipopolysaccharide transport system permease protein
MRQQGTTSINPMELSRQLWANRSLIATLTRREIEGRYKGSLFGVFWSLLNPLMMLTVFTFVFGQIFKAKWGGSPEGAGATGHLDFAAALFAGLLLYNFMAECISKAPHLVTSQPNYVKKIIFPLELLAIVTILAALFHFLVAFAVVLLLVAFSGWQLTLNAFLLPVVIAPFFLLTLGLTWGLSALGVYLRDIGQLIAPTLTALMFLSPIFYPLKSVDPRFLPIYRLNPLTTVVEESRQVLLYGQAPDWGLWLPYCAVGILIAYAGFVFFQKNRQGFADVI